ncbi:MBL fold metallo-hydrolase [Maritimibacter alkaliphilus]|uniref:MBL fold metallo-hydrolase n=1 Tax=Maritimibacter alkaliphilus TaxID=404236 RepID=UPI001C957F41|nr:MBL fold metallo-hydrolase [Maritimibacter alkaliphilus]MBY6089335.1 MBL fold metallo-hydrolase [Maritimibacter alkaliphilus]
MTRIHRTAVGDAALTVLYDGAMHPQAEAVLPTYDASLAAQADAQTGARAEEPLKFDINACLVEMEGQLVLIDAGNPPGRSPEAGFTPDALEEAGVTPEQITMVLLTHPHGDHVGALLDDAGAARFPNATLVISRTDWEMVHDDALLEALSEGSRSSRLYVRTTLAPYAGGVRLLEEGEEVLPGLTHVPLPGHTPGHSGFRLQDGEDSLLILADVVHSQRFQFALPEWSVIYDLDGDQARATRLALLEQQARSGERVVGMHLDFPGVGRVEAAPLGYRFVPD